MKPLYFVFMVCIIAATVEAITIEDTIYYAGTTNTTVYVVDSTEAGAVSTSDSQINFTDLFLDKYVYTKDGNKVLSPLNDYVNLSFNDGKYYLITDSGSTFDEITDNSAKGLTALLNGFAWLVPALILVLFIVPFGYAVFTGKDISMSSFTQFMLVVIALLTIVVVYAVIGGALG